MCFFDIVYSMVEVKKLSKIVETQPHAAYAAYTHGLASKWNYLLRITDWEENQLNDIVESLEKAIQSHFIPALTGQPPPGGHTRELLALPARLGGLGLMNPAASVKDQRAASQQISAPLVDRIINQDHQLDDCHSVQLLEYQEENTAYEIHEAEGRCQKPPNATLFNVASNSLRKREPPPG